MPDKYIFVASQAAEDNRINQGVSAEQVKYIDHYHIMNYEYSVSDIPDKQLTSPNQNSYSTPLPVVQRSANYTTQAQLLPPQLLRVLPLEYHLDYVHRPR